MPKKKQIDSLYYYPFKGLSPIQSAILSWILSFERDRGKLKEFRMKDTTVAQKLGVTVFAVKKAVKALKTKGLATTAMRGYRQRTLKSVWMNVEIPEKAFCVIRFPLKEDFKQALVRWCYQTSLETLNKEPTIGYVSKLTGMSPKTSRKYLRFILEEQSDYKTTPEERERRTQYYSSTKEEKEELVDTYKSPSSPFKSPSDEQQRTTVVLSNNPEDPSYVKGEFRSCTTHEGFKKALGVNF